MNNIRKRKVLKFVIYVLCILIFVSVFITVRKWLHSEGLHFMIGYGQIHLSKMCEGTDQDGNKIDPRNIVVDGAVTKIWDSGNIWKLNGEIDIVDGLPEDVFPAKLALIEKLDDGFYSVDFSFFALPKRDKISGVEYNSHQADVWIKDGEIVMIFYQSDDRSQYYIYYSDIEMLDIEQIQYCINKNIK